jgi:hypothetical protein
MSRTQEIDVRIKAILDSGATEKGLREIKRLMRELPADSKSFKVAQQGANDFTDTLKGAKTQSQDLVDSLASAPGPIGMLARGYDSLTASTNKWGLAWKATGIGLIVALVGQLVAAFTSNEKAMKKLEPVMIAFEQILGGIFKALEPVFDLFVDLVMWVMPGLQKAIGGLYTAFAALGSFLKNFITVQIKNFMAFGKVLKGVFTLDFDLIKEGFTDVATNIKTAVKNVVDDTTKTWDRYNEGLKETTKTQKKQAKEASDAQNAALQKRKENLETEQKLLLADLEKKKAIDLAAAKSEEERVAIEKKAAEDTYNAKKKTLEDLAKLYGKNTKEYKDYQAQLTSLDAEYIAKKTDFTNKEKELATKAFQDNIKIKQQENKLIVDDLTITYNKQKELYGENSKEARKAQDDIFAAQQKAVNDELALYEKRKAEVGTLTQEEAARVEELKGQQKSLTSTIEIENEKRVKSDRDAAIKRLDDDKKVRDERYAREMEQAGLNFELQNQILQEKIMADEAYFAAQEALYAGNKEKLDEIDRARLANQASYAQQEEQIRQKQVSLNLQAADAAIQALGAETAAGKAALIAKQFILAKELVLEVKRTIAFSKSALAQSKIAVATGAAQTAKVGFPQNIPLLILYAAQAVGIIKTVIDATKSAKEAEAGASADVGAGSVPGIQVPKPRGMATGGLVVGPGGGKSDLIPAMLSNGESVINAQSTSAFRPLLSAINEIGGGKRFAEGGLAISSFAQDNTISQLQTMMNTQQVPIKTYVVASDMSNQQMMDRNIKERSTI